MRSYFYMNCYLAQHDIESTNLLSPSNCIISSSQFFSVFGSIFDTCFLPLYYRKILPLIYNPYHFPVSMRAYTRTGLVYFWVLQVALKCFLRGTKSNFRVLVLWYLPGKMVANWIIFSVKKERLGSVLRAQLVYNITRYCSVPCPVLF